MLRKKNHSEIILIAAVQSRSFYRIGKKRIPNIGGFRPNVAVFGIDFAFVNPLASVFNSKIHRDVSGKLKEMPENSGVRAAYNRKEFYGIRDRRPRLSAVFGGLFCLLFLVANVCGEETGTSVHPGNADKKYTLTVTIHPKENLGWVTAIGTRIGCSSVCAMQFPAGTKITLVPKPADGFAFESWSIEIGVANESTDHDPEDMCPASDFNAEEEVPDLSNALLIEINSNLKVSAIFKPVNRELTKNDPSAPNKLMFHSAS